MPEFDNSVSDGSTILNSDASKINILKGIDLDLGMTFSSVDWTCTVGHVAKHCGESYYNGDAKYVNKTVNSYGRSTESIFINAFGQFDYLVYV